MYIARSDCEAAIAALAAYRRRQYEINALNSQGRISSPVMVMICPIAVGVIAVASSWLSGHHWWRTVICAAYLVMCLVILAVRMWREHSKKQKLTPVIDPFQACLENKTIIPVSEQVVHAVQVGWDGEWPGHEEVERALTANFDTVAGLPTAEFPTDEERSTIFDTTREIARAYQGRLI